jgi:hypothetical protein
MATSIDNQRDPRSLEDELQDLALDENELDDRASSLELRTILIAMLAGTALVFSVAALAVALIRTGGNSSSASPPAAAPASAGNAVAGAGPANTALPVENVRLSIKADAKPGSDGKTHDAFLPTTNLSVKAGQRVRMTVYNYDDMPHSFTSPGLAKGAAIPAGEQQMQGTPQDIKTMPAPGVGVDKTIRAGSDKRPSKTIVTFTAPAKAGSYIWYCKMPCDAWAMSHVGYMVGRVQVMTG